MKRTPRPNVAPPIRPVTLDQLARAIAGTGSACVPPPPRGGWDGNHNPKRLVIAAAPVGGGWDQNHNPKRLRVTR